MAQFDLTNTTTTAMKTGVSDFEVDSKYIDEPGSGVEYFWYNTKWSERLGYLKSIPEFARAIESLVMWTMGLGYKTDSRTQIILEHMRGWGKETFHDIIRNMLFTEYVNGDSYAEIIEDEETGTLINLKCLNPVNVRHVVAHNGLIKRYDVWDGGSWIAKKPEKILHFCLNRIASEAHGTSPIEACKWVIDARNEAMSDKRRAMHRKLIRILEVEASDTATFNTLKEQWKDAINNGEVLILPKGSVGVADVPEMSTAEHSEWIRYLESFYYKAIGVSEAILGGTAEFTEAGSKVATMNFEVPHKAARRKLEEDLLAQLNIIVEYDEPPSLKDGLIESEAANTGQLGFQQNEVTAQAGRVE